MDVAAEAAGTEMVAVSWRSAELCGRRHTYIYICFTVNNSSNANEVCGRQLITGTKKERDAGVSIIEGGGGG